MPVQFSLQAALGMGAEHGSPPRMPCAPRRRSGTPTSGSSWELTDEVRRAEMAVGPDPWIGGLSGARPVPGGSTTQRLRMAQEASKIAQNNGVRPGRRRAGSDPAGSTEGKALSRWQLSTTRSSGSLPKEHIYSRWRRNRATSQPSLCSSAGACQGYSYLGAAVFAEYGQFHDVASAFV
jgi:hypothetical protein